MTLEREAGVWPADNPQAGSPLHGSSSRKPRASKCRDGAQEVDGSKAPRTPRTARPASPSQAYASAMPALLEERTPTPTRRDASRKELGVASPSEEEIVVTRLGIKSDPPTLVVEYVLDRTGRPSAEARAPKKYLHNVHMNMSTNWTGYRTQELLQALRSHERHGNYVRQVPAQQLQELLRRLRSIVLNNQAARDGGDQEQDAAVPALPSFGNGSAPGRGRSSPPCAQLGHSRSTPLGRMGSSKARAGPRPGRTSSRPPAAPGDPAGPAGPSGAGGGAAPRPEPPEPHAAEEVVPWPSGAWAEWSLARARDASEGQGAAELFESFRTSRGALGIASSFAQLFHASATASGPAGKPAATASCTLPMDAIRSAVGSQRRFPRALWERLDARFAAASYRDRPLAGRRAVCVGGGPVGLRAALEMRLLGADVVVLERRLEFTRINRLHLWSWCADDLKGWGAKVLEPPELSFGSDPDFLHIGISELQMLLMKVCLLLGVQIFFGVEFLGAAPIDHPAQGALAEWEVLLKPGASAEDVPGPVAPTRLRGVSVLIGADGPRSAVSRVFDFQSQEMSALRKEAALGLVANYANQQTSAEKNRRPFSLARQFYESLFKEAESVTGMELENVVCYISSQTHYFVMTPTCRSLKALGVLADGEANAEGGLLATLDQDKLAVAARAVAAFPWRAEDKPMPEATLNSPVGPASLFDFSRTKRSAAGLRVLESAAAGDSVDGCKNATVATRPLLVGLCGDALIEPFWPEGLGIMRGFFAALDVASAAKVWAETGSAMAAESHFEGAFRQLKSLAAKTRGSVLKPDDSSFALNPSTRYRVTSVAVGRANSMPAMRVVE